MDQYQYKLLEDNQDYKEATIEKSGITATFSINDIEKHENDLETFKREIEGQLGLERAKMANIEHFHPDVTSLDGEALTAAALYKESKTMMEKFEPKLEEVNTALAEYAAEKEHIIQVLGFPMNPETPVENPVVEAPVVEAPVEVPVVETPVEAPVEAEVVSEPTNDQANTETDTEHQEG